MTPDQLLQPRYKVIADYPFQNYQIGQIIEGETAYLISGDGWSEKGQLSDYTSLFTKLRWFEYRKPDEMPKYVKEISGNEVWVVEEYGAAITSYVLLKKNFIDAEIPYGDHSLYDLLPATETEFITYQNSIK